MQEILSFIVLQLAHATKRTACALGSMQLVIFLSHHHATPARVRFRPSIGTRMRSNEQEWFFRNCLPERLIPHLDVGEIPMHTLLIHGRDVHTFVEAQVSISGNFVFHTLVVRFRLDVFPIANEHSFIRRLLSPLVGVRCPLNLLLDICGSFPGWSTVDVHGLCSLWRMEHGLWR